MLAGLAIATAAPALARAQASPPPAALTAAATDVATSDAIVAALYDVISDDAGVPRDWNRFRSLFHPSAKLIPIGTPAEGPSTATSLSPDDYIARAEPFLMRGFHEREVARRVETFGHMTHVFSTYESRHAAADETPFARGINSIQLFDDGTRWWIVSVYWQGETPTIPLPPAYLPGA
ncbi:hypothetical protein MMB232_01232 [Brevundimonas subvibrioides]|uniref:hypothetical protein n=1 Tax=Brevundimonas subvibrioides TaxID=74313 RepID=UPI0032D56A0C